MARARTKTARKGAVEANGSGGEVLTLAEAAAYLRLPEDEVVRLVHQQGLPGRLTATEWRFFKGALQDWLRTPPPIPSKEAVLSRVGNWKDDPDSASR